MTLKVGSSSMGSYEHRSNDLCDQAKWSVYALLGPSQVIDMYWYQCYGPKKWWIVDFQHCFVQQKSTQWLIPVDYLWVVICSQQLNLKKCTSRVVLDLWKHTHCCCTGKHTLHRWPVTSTKNAKKKNSSKIIDCETTYIIGSIKKKRLASQP